MVTLKYKLNKDLIGRTASQFNWALQDYSFYVYLKIRDGRIINGKSLIGLLSGRFKKGDEIEIATYTQEQLEVVKKVIEELQIATQI